MYLKRIDLHGFKSFADKVKIEFLPGINAIVGPNGSGKSNITDAIRWVLGEQSIKTIRGTKLEDVIFAGSNNKRSMGMAEVSLTLDNSSGLLPLDYSEICFTRKVFRSGESEFYINKTPCRLKDIQELLMDTGIGKDGYSIIGQGQVDEILTCRPEERRAIFEEAAGIFKHKTRKKEAQKHLEETMANVNRVNDILVEIKNQLGPLEEQRLEAIKYKELSAEYKDIDISLLIDEYTKKQDVLQKANEEFLKNKCQLKNYVEKKANITDLHNQYKSKLENLEQEYEKKKVLLFNLDNKRKDIERDIQWNNNEIKQLINEKEEMQNNIAVIVDKINSTKQIYQTTINRLEEKIKHINLRDIELGEKHQKLANLDEEMQKKQELIERLKGDVIEILNDASQKRNMITGLKTMKKNLQDRLLQIEREKATINQANNITINEIKRLCDEKQKLNSYNVSYKTQIEDLRVNLQKHEEKLAKITKSLSQTQEKLSNYISKFRALKDIEENFEGYNYGVKNLLSSLKNNKLNSQGIYGTIASIITVDKIYETATETALGSTLQNILCHREEDAKRAIEYLKENKMGRVTFLPISTIKPKTLSSREKHILSIEGCISVAKELISYDTKYDSIIGYLLGRVIVAKDMDAAINIARKSNFSIKIVTLDGELIMPGGAITGGSRKGSSQILSRKRKLQEAKEIIEKLENTLKGEKGRFESIKRLTEDTKASIEVIQNNFYDIKSKIAVIDKELQEKQKIVEERQQREMLLDAEIKHIKSEEANIDTEILDIEGEVGNLDTKNKESHDLTLMLQQELINIKNQREEIANIITESKINLASLKQEEIAFTQKIQAAKENIDSLTAEKNFLEAKLKENEKKHSSIKKSLEGNTIQIKQIEENIVINKKALEELLSQKEDIKIKIKQYQEKLISLEEKQNVFEKKINEYRLKESKLKMEIELIANRLGENYYITPDEAIKLKTNIGDCNKAKERLATIKNELKSLGNVNLQAIQDYERQKARYDFLISQRNDLLKAKEDLNQLIKSVTKTMEEMLATTIDNIQKEFKKTFTELFGGGYVELVIEGEKNLLEAGIDIVAQPPGKKLQNLSLLSGGERALTAIALLFAFLNTKRTPFCVLDEIEAALDDANIERFSSYLKKISAHTQFIIITHRKGTMEVADALYGISMENTATSKILSVKLET